MPNKTKVMIVEDEESLAKLLSDKLNDNGYETFVVEDGESAIKKFGKISPQVVISDIILPKKSGFDFIEHVRLKEKSNVPVIVLTNLDQNSDRELGNNLGVDEFFLKSNISMAAVVAKVRELEKKSL
jgi:DNA-binding response OmpR family regulator